jgi:PD-(D/E)XK nuclease superfamily protein
MTDLKRKGDLAELMVAADLRRRGNRILFPYGEDCDYDLVAERPDGRFERVQVKYTTSDGAVIRVRCRSLSLTNGKVRATKKYTAAMIDWIGVYDATTERCYYVPATHLGEGRSYMHLRLTPARSGRRLGIHDAADFLQF